VTVDGSDIVSSIGAAAASGAGGGNVSVAGTVAIAIVKQVTTADVFGAVALTGDLDIDAASALAVTVSALPLNGGAVGGSVGVGAAYALALVDDSTTAAIRNGAAISAADISVQATSSSASSATAVIGAAGGGVGIAPA